MQDGSEEEVLPSPVEAILGHFAVLDCYVVKLEDRNARTRIASRSVESPDDFADV